MGYRRHRHIPGRRRVNVCAALGLLAGLASVPFGPWQLALLTGWVTVASTLLGWIWVVVGPSDAAQTRAMSTAEDQSRVTSVLVMVVASAVSLVGVGFALAKARHVGSAMEVTLTAMAALAVVLSWALVHSVFAEHYAHLYYTEPVGGIEFPGNAAPDYRDFAYYSFTIGMSFAVSDADVTSSRIRRSTLRHALVSYLFGTVIVGLAINVIAGFIR